MKQYFEFWKQGFNFTGETTRYNYWYIQLINGLIVMGMINLMFLGMMCSHSLPSMRVSVWTGVAAIGLFWLLSLIPEFALNVRRLRNAGLPWALIFIKIFGNIFEVLMLFPAKKSAPRLERKERFILLSVISMVISITGWILLINSAVFHLPASVGIIAIVTGLIMGIADLVLNMKRRRIMALLSLTVAMMSCIIFFSMKTVAQFNHVYENSSSVLPVDRAVYDALNNESVRDGRPVADLEIFKSNEVIQFDGVNLEVVSTKPIGEGYVRIAVNMQNTSKESIDLYDVDFELANNKEATRLLQYNNVEAGFALNEYNFRLLGSQEIAAGETLKGTVAFEAPIEDAKYLVLGEDGERQVAIELNH